MSRNLKLLLIGLLFFGTVALYWPVRHFEFVSMDDTDYVTENASVRAGLTGASIAWAFTNTFSSNWHPLTWISHTLDWQLFGENAGGHHLVSVALHGLNSVILFLFLCSVTSAPWRSAAVALFFAWHPTHVESVAWIAERKDVLSGFFGILALWAYAKYAKPAVVSQHSKGWYCGALVLFACGLMSKPMLVTWPFVMLLLDFWPLGRMTDGRPKWVRLVVEKLPFFALVIGSCAITVFAQSKWHALAPTSAVPLEFRLANAVTAYLKYIGKIFWPTNLAAFYPFPREIPYGLASLSIVVLIVMAIVVIRFAKARPYLLTGWFWFLGSLVPVIGFVQVGGQSFADRYLYLPSIGLFVAFVWFVGDVVAKLPHPARLLAPVTAGALVACVWLSAKQIPTWRNSKILFTHAEKVTENNYLAYTALGSFANADGDFAKAESLFKQAIDCGGNFPSPWVGRGSALAAMGERAEGIAAVREALNLSPHDFYALANLGRLYLEDNKMAEAEPLLREAVEQRPGSAEAQLTYGEFLRRTDRTEESLPHFAGAVELKPRVSHFRIRYAEALKQGKRLEEALTQYRAALKNQPDDLNAHLALAGALIEMGRPAEAEAELQPFVHAAPTNSLALDAYGFALASNGKAEQALPYFEQAIALAPTNAFAHLHLGMVLQNLGRPAEAVAQFRKLLTVDSNSVPALNNLAWMLATSPNQAVRDGHEAVKFAQRACDLTENREPLFIGTLAAAYAEAGQFAEAVAAAEKAQALAQSLGMEEVAKRNGELRELYRTGKQFRDQPAGGTIDTPP